MINIFPAPRVRFPSILLASQFHLAASRNRSDLKRDANPSSVDPQWASMCPATPKTMTMPAAADLATYDISFRPCRPLVVLRSVSWSSRYKMPLPSPSSNLNFQLPHHPIMQITPPLPIKRLRWNYPHPTVLETSLTDERYVAVNVPVTYSSS